MARSAALALLIIAACAGGAAAFDFSGLFASHYPTKSCLDVVSMSLSGSQWNATKKTGTSAVPAGKVSFFFDLDPSGSTKMAGWGQMASAGYVDPYWAPVFIETGDSPDEFTVTDDMSRPLPNNRNRWGTQTYNRWFEVCKSVEDTAGEALGSH